MHWLIRGHIRSLYGHEGELGHITQRVGPFVVVLCLPIDCDIFREVGAHL